MTQQPKVVSDINNFIYATKIDWKWEKLLHT